MATKPEKSEQTTNPAPQDRHDPEPPEKDIEERLSFPEARDAIADLEGQDQSCGSHSPAWSRPNWTGIWLRFREPSLMRGRLSVSDPAARGFRDDDIAFVLTARTSTRCGSASQNPSSPTPSGIPMADWSSSWKAACG